MDRSRRVFGFLMIVLSILALFSWERWGRVRFIYDDVLELRNNVQKGTVITESMLSTVQVEHAGREALRPADRKKVIGKAAGQFIHARTPLYPQYFQQKELVTGPELDRYALQIPADWAESVPASMRRGDRAVFYFEGSRITDAPVSAVDRKTGNFEVIASRAQIMRLGRIAGNGGNFVISYSR